MEIRWTAAEARLEGLAGAPLGAAITGFVPFSMPKLQL